MVTTSDFLTTILNDILGLPLVGDLYAEYGVSRNIFSRYVGTNNRLGKMAAETLQKVSISEISKNDNKKIQLLDYLKNFLSEEEKNQLTNPKDIISIAVSKYSKQRQNKSKIEVVDIYELVNRGWTFESYMIECFNFWDSTSSSGTMPDEHKGYLDQWVQIITVQPDPRRILLNENGKMIGFWSFLALFDEAFERAKKGQLVDSEVTPAIMPTIIQGNYNIYIPSVMIDKNYQKSLTLQKLLFSMVEAIEKYALNDIFFDEICAWAYSGSGISLSKSLGLKYIKEHEEVGQVYHGRTIDLLKQPIFNNFETLKILYTKHFA